MGKTVSLMMITNSYFEGETELEPTEELKERARTSNYEKTRAGLCDMFERMEFDTELLKGKGGFADKGIYQIPREDGPFIESMISLLKTDVAKKIKAENFEQCRQSDLREIVDGLILILKHLDIDPEVIELQKTIMEQKTMLYINEEFEKMAGRVYQSMHAFANMLPNGNNRLSYDETCQYLKEVREGLAEYLGGMEHEYMTRNREKMNEYRKTAIRVNMEEMDFSERSQIIMNRLSANDEYVDLKKELDELYKEEGKKTASKVIAKKKRKKQITDRIYEIFNESIADLPVDVQKMTTIEKYMCLVGDEGLHLVYDQEEKCFWMVPQDNYFATDWVKKNSHPMDE